MSRQAIEASVEQILRDVIPGFRSRVPEHSIVGGRVDLMADVQGRRVVVETKRVLIPVVEDVIAKLSMGALQARRLADEMDAVPLVAVLVPSLGPKTIGAAVEFMAAHLPDAGWALVDPAGNARVRIPELGIDIERPVARIARPQAGRSSVRLFSDLNRWLLKILLLADAPAELWGGPRQPILSSPDLSRVAGVSPEMVRRFVRAFGEQDLLRQTPRGMRLVRRSALLDLWRADEALNTRPAVPVRRMLAGSGSLTDLSGLADFQEWAVVAGFEACRLLGVLHAIVPPRIEVHVVLPIPEVIRRLGLEECAPADADLWLLPTRYSRSIRGGKVLRDGVPVVDAFQAALDVLRHPGRGQEQSEYLLKEVLHLEGGD